GGDAIRGKLLDAVGVGRAVGECPGEDRRVGRHADHVACLDQFREASARDALARQVIEPDADAGGAEVCGGGSRQFSLSARGAAATTAAVVTPNFWKRVL